MDDLIDDWHRAGGSLAHEDVMRLSSKRSLGADQLVAVLASLSDAGIEVHEPGRNASVAEDDGLSEDTGFSHDLDVVAMYLREIGQFGLLWAEDEVRLGRTIRAGLAADEMLNESAQEALPEQVDRQRLAAISNAGRSAHAEFVRANLRLVVSIAKAGRYRLSGVELIDRIQDGNIGLMRAANKFDPALGYKFSTYATWWIRQSIDRGIADCGRLIRIPVHLHEKVSRVRRTKYFLERSLGRDPTVQEVAETVNVEPAAAAALLELSAPIRSLDASVGTEGDLTLGDLLANTAEVDGRLDPYKCAVVSALHRDLEQLMVRLLDERERQVVKRRSGMLSGEEETLQAISEDLQLSRERVRQIESKAMKSLAAHCQSLRSYLVEGDQPVG